MPIRELKTTSSRDAFFDIARGLRPDCQSVHLFGINNAVGTSFEAIYDNGGVYPFPTSAQALTLVSDDAGDTMDVLIEGLDADWNPITETVTLSGLTEVSTTYSFYRVNNAQITSGENAGDIIVSSGTDTVAIIQAGKGVHQAAVYSIPAGHRLYVKRAIFDGDITGNKVFRFRAAVHDPEADDLRLRFWESITATDLEFMLDIPFVVQEKKDFCLEAKAVGTTGAIACYIAGILINEGE